MKLNEDHIKILMKPIEIRKKMGIEENYITSIGVRYKIGDEKISELEKEGYVRLNGKYYHLTKSGSKKILPIFENLSKLEAGSPV